MLFFILSKSYLYQKINNLTQNGFLIKQKFKLSAKHEEDMKKPLSKINEDPEAYRTMFSGPAVCNEDLKHINPQDPIAFDWEKFHKDNGIVPWNRNYTQ